MLPVAILAGGLATRLRPLTDRVPKSLMIIAGHPFIFHQLELLRGQGVSRVVLCVGHLGEQIQAAVERRTNLGLCVEYSFDGGGEQKGTGGALKQALARLGPEFFVLNGDSYTPYPLARVESAFISAGLPALMTVLRNENRWDKSNVWYSQGKLIEYDKRSPRAYMNYIDFGISIVSHEVLASQGGSEPFELSDVFQDLSLKGRLAALKVSERFYEIGSPQGMRETDAYLSRIGSLGPTAAA
jgi:MurNAc alpha-1-phosphate uridylyltransferase